METTQNLAQKQPAQLIQPEQQPTKLLYNPSEAAQIAGHLTGIFDPEYILLFGKLVGGIPHSEITAYDLLVVVRGTPEYDWIRAKRILRYKMPVQQREIPYINLYLMTLKDLETHPTPFLYFAHSEGELLYCSDHCHFRRPKRPINFAAAYAAAKLHYDTFHTLGEDLLEQANDLFRERRNTRLSALFSAQAAICFYHTLYYVYHGQVFESRDPELLHERMRTLSTKLMLSFDDNHLENTFTMPHLKRVLLRILYDVGFDIPPRELETQLSCIGKLNGIVGNLCTSRMGLYKELSERQ